MVVANRCSLAGLLWLAAAAALRTGARADSPSLLDWAVNPTGSGMRFLMPNTYDALSADLGQNVQRLTAGAQAGLGGLQSAYASMGDAAGERLQALQAAGQRRYAEGGQMAERMLEFAQNPQQACARLQAGAYQLLASAPQLMGSEAPQQQQQQQPQQSLFSKFGGSFPSFG